MFLSKEAKEYKKQEKLKAQEENQRPIDIFTINNLPGVEFKALQMIMVEEAFHRGYLSENVKTGATKLIEKMKKEARKIDADAIVGFNINTTVSNDEKHHYSTSIAFGTAIKYIVNN